MREEVVGTLSHQQHKVTKCKLLVPLKTSVSILHCSFKLLSYQITRVQQQAKTDSPDDNTTYFTGCCSTFFMLAGQSLFEPIRNNSQRGPEHEEFVKEISHSTQDSGDRYLSTLVPLAIEKVQRETSP
ncbi:hypothetical protein WN944_025450 [Citrus x changshan-huyou]|uniref:Uncharacterized protein n=1 Tax=Citrus x changshan-huyou TaxID=2935761 RepID=A0AAP0LQF6_9ROSI